jgi:short-subunit dehydrogenase
MRILITGATSGIGKSLTTQYALEGHHVIACGRNKDKLLHLASSLPSIETLCFDITHYQSYPSLGKGTQPLDLLILNAGDCEYIDNPIEFDARLFERVINTNLISVGYALQAWLKHMSPGSRLVFVSSSAGLLPLPRAEAYGTSKAALSYLAKSLSVTLSKHDINVTVVHPGFVKTPLTDKNTFKMPMIIPEEEAAINIMKGIEKGKREINFPIIFIFTMKLLRLLPWSLWQRIATRMTSL